jgi:hypothetical protein
MLLAMNALLKKRVGGIGNGLDMTAGVFRSDGDKAAGPARKVRV